MDAYYNLYLVKHDTPLFAAVKNRTEAKVRELLACGARPTTHTAKRETAFHQAACRGDASIVALLPPIHL